jgi:hypothetical protein
MNTRKRIDAFYDGEVEPYKSKGRKPRKPPAYDAFADELAWYVDAMEPAPNSQYADVRETMRLLSRQLRELQEHQRTGWWPILDSTGGQREWVDSAIYLGEELERVAVAKTAPSQVARPLKHVAELWKQYYDKSPGLSDNSPFTPLFNYLFPRFYVATNTARKILL